ncbi:MAG: adenosylmethionine--8-amino-7-oxononanoate transaminase [Planctomycetes bacterium]|nr:adenosylmethionine--8-amino-7-oxononanoate transaminase [Planctomycetota bacterium]
MTDLLVLGTDTDAGKTAFCSQWLAAFHEQWEYWKPVETGNSDTATVRALVPGASVHAPLKALTEPVAPLLAARRAGDTVPCVATIVAARPTAAPGRGLLIETFGGPFSPLDEADLQIALVRALACPSVLVSSSALGAIGRTLQCLDALAGSGIRPLAVVLLGSLDAFAAEQIGKHGRVPVGSLKLPAAWEPAAIADSARQQSVALQDLRGLLPREGEAPAEPRTRESHDRRTARQEPRPPELGPRTPRLESRPTASADLQARDRRVVWHPYTSLCAPDLPLPCIGAEDEFLILADGRRLIDGISSWWTILHGHRHPPLVQALHDALAQIDHVLFAGVTHPWAVDLAELLLQTTPWRGGRVFYSDNGSTAVEVALKMAYQYWCQQGEPGRTRFVGFEAGYHGDTFGAMSVSRDPVFFGRFEPLLFHADIVPVCADRLEAALRKRPGEVAAVIIEPLVQGAGGMRMHTPDELRDIVAAARASNVLVIVDEVMTGGGRTGTLWAHQAARVVPDLICSSKTLTGGMMPLAATLVSPMIVSAFDSPEPSGTFFHGHSFTAHPLACAVAVASWRILTEQPSLAPARMEEFWQASLTPLQELPHVRDVRIRGCIAAVELNVPGGYLADAGRSMRQLCLQHDVFLRPLGNVLYALPPLCTSPASLERIAAAMHHAVRSIADRA